LDRGVFESETDTTKPQCQSDADCPVATILGQPTQLLCAPEAYVVDHAEAGECYYPDIEISNYFLHAYFGESYEPYGLNHPTRSVPINYCHINPDYLDDPEDERNDFAYCILAEEPDVQPLPVMMHCEVDAFMNGQYDLDARAVGFGVAGANEDVPANKAGRKRWALATTDTASFASNNPYLSLALFSTFDPGGPTHGDSGSPMLIKLPPPHDTWHVFGIMVKPLLAVAPWHYMEWMHENPEVVDSNILPCHEPDGSWAPSETCGSFPLTPGNGVGDWAFGPNACHDANVSGWSSTCGAPYDGSPLPGPGDDLAPPKPSRDPDRVPGPGSVTPAESMGCSVAGRSGPFGLLLLGLPLLALRRRRSTFARSDALVLCLLVLVTGCPVEVVDADEFGTDTGAEPTEPVEMHPSLHKTHSGLELEGTEYSRLAVGNIARPIGDPSCCQDVVLGGAMSAEAEVFFGGGSTERGLTFLDDRPTQAYTMAATGDGIMDLALVDLNADGRNDLLAVTTGGQLGVRLGVASATYLGSLNLFGIGGGKVLGRLDAGDLDCDGDLDVVSTAPNDGGIVLALQTGGGAFGPGTFVATVAAEDDDEAGNPQDVAVGDLDGEGALDVVSMNDDGTATTYLRGGCGGGPTVTSKTVYSNVGDCAESEDVYSCVSDTIGGHVITDDVFCGTPLSDVTVAFADRVLTFCNDGDINAAISTSGYADYRWDVNASTEPSAARIKDINWWPTPEALHALEGPFVRRLAAPGTDFHGNLTPRVLGLFARARPIEFVMSRHSDDGVADWWQRIIWLSSEGELGFVR
jgi:hypothetical protein